MIDSGELRRQQFPMLLVLQVNFDHLEAHLSNVRIEVLLVDIAQEFSMQRVL